MPSVIIDTHVVVWYITDSSKLSVAASQAIDDATKAGMPIFVPSIVLVELQYLVEKNRIPQLVLDRINANLDQPGANLQVVALDQAIARSIALVPRIEVPDMPDRIIAATALSLKVPLVSRDRKIQASSVQTIW